MATIQGPTSVRVGEVASYYAFPSTGITYTWTLDESSGAVITSGQGSDCVTICWELPGQYHLHVSIQLPNGQTDLGVVVITAGDEN